MIFKFRDDVNLKGQGDRQRETMWDIASSCSSVPAMGLIVDIPLAPSFILTVGREGPGFDDSVHAWRLEIQVDPGSPPHHRSTVAEVYPLK